MMNWLSRFFWIAISFGAMCLTLCAAEPLKPFNPPAEPLPPGARQRIGSSLYRVDHSLNGALTTDGKSVLLPRHSIFTGSSLLDLTTGRLSRDFRIGQNIILPPRALTRGPYVISNNEKELQVTELSTGKVVHRWTGSPFDWKDGLLTSALSASSDGKTVAFGEEDRVDNGYRAHAWIVRFGVKDSVTELKVMQHGRIWAEVSPDGKTLVTGGGLSNNEQGVKIDPCEFIQIWDVATGKERHRVRVKDRSKNTTAVFSRDGKQLLAYSRTVIDVVTGKSTCTLPEEPDTSNCEDSAFSPDGKDVVGIFPKGTVSIWDAATGKLLKEYAAPQIPKATSLFAGIYGSGIGFTPDDRLIALGAWGSVKVAWDPESGKFLTPIEGFPNVVTHLAYTPDGKGLYAASADLHLVRWNLSNPKEPAPIDFPVDPSEKQLVYPIYSRLRAIAPDRKYQVVSRSIRGATLTAFDFEKGIERYRIAGVKGLRAYDLALPVISPDGKWLACGGDYLMEPGAPKKPLLQVYDARKGTLVENIKLEAGPHSVCAFSPDSRTLISITSFYTPKSMPMSHLASWDIGKGESLAAVDLPVHFSVQGAAIAADNRTVLLYRVDRTRAKGITMIGWDTVTGKITKEVELPIYPTVMSPAVSPDGKWVAIAGRDAAKEPVVLLLAWPALKLAESWKGHHGEIATLVFSPDSKTLASGGDDTTILLWNVAGAGK